LRFVRGRRGGGEDSGERGGRGEGEIGGVITGSGPASESEVGLKPESRIRSGFGGDGGEEKLGDPEDEEGPKRRRRTSVCQCAVEGERATGGMRHAHSMIFRIIMHQ